MVVQHRERVLEQMGEVVDAGPLIVIALTTRIPPFAMKAFYARTEARPAPEGRPDGPV